MSNELALRVLCEAARDVARHTMLMSARLDRLADLQRQQERSLNKEIDGLGKQVAGALADAADKIVAELREHRPKPVAVDPALADDLEADLAAAPWPVLRADRATPAKAGLRGVPSLVEREGIVAAATADLLDTLAGMLADGDLDAYPNQRDACIAHFVAIGYPIHDRLAEAGHTGEAGGTDPGVAAFVARLVEDAAVPRAEGGDADGE